MSWSAKLTYFTCLAVLFISCKQESNIGVDALPTNNLIGTSYTDTISVATSTVFLPDSIASSRKGYYMVGAYGDPDLGDVWAETYTQVRQRNENVNLQAATADSVVLFMDYQGYALGDTTQSQTLEVYQLSTRAYDTATYYTNSPAPPYTTLLGSTTFNASPGYASAASKKVYLNNSYGQSILNLGSLNNADFLDNVFGLAIIPASHNQGAVLRLNLNRSNTKVIIYYTSGGVSQQQCELLINIGGQGFHRICYDRSSTLLSSFSASYQELSSTLTGDKVYMQAGTGLKAKISFPHISAFRDCTKAVLINRAILVMPSASGIPSYLSTTSPGFILLETDASNQIKKNSNGNIVTVQAGNYDPLGVTNTLGVSYNLTSNEYEIDITRYMQALLMQKLPYTSFMLSPFPELAALEVNRTALNSNSNLVSNHCRLELYYTQPK